MKNKDLIKRLAKELKVTLPIATEIYQTLKRINLEAVNNKENIAIPGIGSINVIAYEANRRVYSPARKTKVVIKKTHYFKLRPFKSALCLFNKDINDTTG